MLNKRKRNVLERIQVNLLVLNRIHRPLPAEKMEPVLVRCVASMIGIDFSAKCYDRWLKVCFYLFFLTPLQFLRWNRLWASCSKKTHQTSKCLWRCFYTRSKMSQWKNRITHSDGRTWSCPSESKWISFLLLNVKNLTIKWKRTEKSTEVTNSNLFSIITNRYRNQVEKLIPLIQTYQS